LSRLGSSATLPTDDHDQSIAENLGVSFDYFQKTVYGPLKAPDSTLLTMSEAEAADIDGSSFVTDDADADAVTARVGIKGPKILDRGREVTGATTRDSGCKTLGAKIPDAKTVATTIKDPGGTTQSCK
jgi:hypothetical protein